MSMNMFNGLFRKQDAKGNVVVAVPKGIEFTGGEQTITPIRVYHNDNYMGRIEKRGDEFVFITYGSYGVINYNVCAKIAEKLKELNGKDSDNK